MKHVLLDATFISDYLRLSDEIAGRIHFDLEYVMFQNADHPEGDFERLIVWARGGMY